MTRPSQNSLPSPARRVAFDVLRRVETEAAYASAILASITRDTLSVEDLALAHEITLGVLRWRKMLDHLIELNSKRSIDRLDLPVLIALRIGLYQLRYLDRIPQSAAVNESVKLVKYAKVASAAAFVNAVLRKAATQATIAGSEDITDHLEQLAVNLSHPRWLLERWIALLGEQEAAQLAIANNQPPSTAFRVNIGRGSTESALALLEREGVRSRPSSIVDGAFLVEGGRITPDSEAMTRGLVYLQDEASQAVSRLLDPRAGERVLDLCAAPGSKSTHIASLSNDQAWVIACDLRPRRLLTLRASCRRMGLTSIDPIAADATASLPFDPAMRFDRVLIDAPCSGTGTLRQNPEIKWRLDPADVSRLSKLQLMLLHRGSLLIREGGRLVYSTCSIEPEENEQVVSKFLEQNPQFQLKRPEISAELITREGFMRTFPHRHGTDGFFAAVLQRVPAR